MVAKHLHWVVAIVVGKLNWIIKQPRKLRSIFYSSIFGCHLTVACFFLILLLPRLHGSFSRQSGNTGLRGGFIFSKGNAPPFGQILHEAAVLFDN